MYVLRVEHRAPDYDEWKKVFDSDPLGRERSGVRRYRIERAIDDPNRVFVDLSFDSSAEAESFLRKLREAMTSVIANVITNPKVQLTEVVETREL